MPFKSQAQRAFLFAKHPEIAKEFAAATPKGKKLPLRVSSKHGGSYSSPGMKSYVDKRKKA
jgi:hypothetical protein